MSGDLSWLPVVLFAGMAGWTALSWEVRHSILSWTLLAMVITGAVGVVLSLITTGSLPPWSDPGESFY